jgi:hypothetical protein
MEEYYEKHIRCDWCGYSTRGYVDQEEQKVCCTSCHLPLVDDLPGLKDTLKSLDEALNPTWT